MESPVDQPEGQTPGSNLQQECLYYLNAYGTHLALISFYMRHDCMTEALTYLLSKVRPAPNQVYQIFSDVSHLTYAVQIFLHT